MIFGYQISYYLLYRYLKIRKEGLVLNRFFLAFSLLYKFGVTGMILRHFFQYYFEGTLEYEYLMDCTHLLVALAAISFLIILSSNAFDYLIPVQITRSIAFVTVLLSILIFVVSDQSFKNGLILLSAALGGLFAFFVHIQLLRKSTGQVKIRLGLLFLGNAVIAIAIVFLLENHNPIYNPELQEIVKYLYAPVSILGEAIVLYAIFDIPIFLEFNWKDSLIKLYVIDAKGNQIIFDYDFTKSEAGSRNSSQNNDNNETFFSSGLVGIESIIGAVTNSQKEKISKIQQGDLLILLDHGDDPYNFLIYCVTVKQELLSTTFFLHSIKKEFQNHFKTLLHYMDALKGREREIFNKFSTNLINILNNS